MVTAIEPQPRSLRGLGGVLSANAAAWSATRLLSIALPWFVLSTTGSATQTGLVVFCQMGPYVVSQVLSGPLIDRIGPKRISVACDVTAMVAMGAAPLLYLSGALQLWVLMALMAVVGAADGPSNAAKGVFVPSATRAARMSLERGTGLTGAVERTATTAGPAIAGVVIAAFGSVYALWAAAALFGFGALIVATTLTNPIPEEHLEPTEGYVRQFREGANFLRNEGLLRAIVGMVAVTNLLDQAFIAVLLPVWAKASGHGPEAVGLVVSVFAAASIIASLAAAAARTASLAVPSISSGS
ncbi:MAG: MFS transporter [Nocardioidaceae bacterium]